MAAETGTITIPAGGKIKIAVGRANYVYAYDASGLIEVALLRDRKRVQSHVLGRLGLIPERSFDFDEIEIRDKSGSSNTVRIFYGAGDYQPAVDRAQVVVDDSTPIGVDIVQGSFTVNTTVEPSDTMSTSADVTVGGSAVQLVAASNTRKKVTVVVPTSATANIRIGSSSAVTINSGILLEPGDRFSEAYEGALWAISDGADVDVSVEGFSRP